MADLRILYFGNNYVGWQILRWLASRGERVVGLVLNVPGKQRYGDEIRATARLDTDRVFTGDALRDPATARRLAALEPDIGLSVLFSHVLQPDIFNIPPLGCLNLHPAYLPHNRGAYTNVWSIIDGTPAGVTLHYIDEGVDTGDIVARRRVPVLPTDTGERLYHRLEQASLELFRDTWPRVRSGDIPRQPQDQGRGLFHRVRDVERVDAIDLDRRYTARELIDIIRARTFPPYPGAYVERDGQRIYLRLQLLTEGELAGGAKEE